MPSPVVPSQIKDAVASVTSALCLKLWKLFSLPSVFYDWYSYVYREKFTTGETYFTDDFVADLATGSECDCSTVTCSIGLNAIRMVAIVGNEVLQVCGDFFPGDQYKVYANGTNLVAEGFIPDGLHACDIGGTGKFFQVFLDPLNVPAYYKFEITRPGCAPESITTEIPSSSSSSSSASSGTVVPENPCGEITVETVLGNVRIVTAVGMVANKLARVRKTGILGVGCVPKPEQIVRLWVSTGGTDVQQFSHISNPSNCGQPTYFVDVEFTQGNWSPCYAFN